ncbi:hybrid sensor histidine kinase/response regulator, partial [Mangrovicoccus algicola]|nr:response regulator [Mangrovicoccus algicola]
MREPVQDDADRGEAEQGAPASARPVLRAVARLIATDRRAVVLAGEAGDVLLANAPAGRLGLGRGSLRTHLDWPQARLRARRAGSAPAVVTRGDQALEGELVHLPLGTAEGYLLRLSESDQEAVWLRNRARAAALMRVAHDLRTPIQSLLVTAEQALGGAEDAEAARLSRARLRRAADLALDHLGNVLAVIGGEQGAAGLLPDEDFDIAQELRNLLEMIRPIARSRGTALELEIDAPGAPWLHGPLRFVRALGQNMIDNAVKHGGARAEMRLCCRPLPGDALEGGASAAADGAWRVTLEMRDLGGGLPDAQKRRIEHALAGTAPPPGAARRGSAGLEVMGHALRQLGGTLEVADRPGAAPGQVRGTVLRAEFSLPAAPPRATGAAQPQGQPVPQVLAGRRILVVEDSPASRDWLVHVLRGAGAETCAASDPREALALLEAPAGASIAAVLSDVTLPGMSGIEMTRRIRAAASWQGLVLGLTAHADAGIRQACLGAGMARVLEKPVRPAQLCAALAEALEGVPAAQPPAADPGGGPQALDPEVAADLVTQLGAARARDFMSRAREEAAAALARVRAQGLGPATRPVLHAATGAAGLTGLARIE